MGVYFNEGKEKLVQGVELISDAVSSTFGPNGRNVVIKNEAGVHITKDGATVANFVNSEDEIVSVGIEIIKDIAAKTAKDVGDGTTTSTILARALVDKLKNEDIHPMEMNTLLERDLNNIIKYLEENKIVISSREDLVKVATISANNDIQLGELIAATFDKVGKDGIVTFEESSEVTDSVIYSDGFEIKSGYVSPYFANTSKNTCELENVLVAVFDRALEESKDLLPIIKEAMEANKQLLVIAPSIDSTITQSLLFNKEQGRLNSCVLVSPGNGTYRNYILSDLKNILGESMTCPKVIIEKEKTSFIGCTIEKTLKAKKIAEIKQFLFDATLGEYDEAFHKKRLASYNGGVATILIGGYSKVEILEKKDRVEDAISAVRAALEGGILPGGGIALNKANSNLDLVLLSDIINKPFEMLVENSGLVEVKIDLPNFWHGYNFKTMKSGNMYDMGVVDPFLVTKTVLENAIQASSLILTNKCVIINK